MGVDSKICSDYAEFTVDVEKFCSYSQDITETTTNRNVSQLFFIFNNFTCKYMIEKSLNTDEFQQTNNGED